ncbi:MAG: anthranilate phosphoribosyltransferase [Simkaniaceae bacterium]
MHLREAIEKLIQGEDLTSESCESIVKEMAEGGNSTQMAAFLALLRAKGETSQEILGIIHAMQNLMHPLAIPGPLLDIVGTGGDGSHSVNISTGSAILAAACGAKVVKHGSRASSSKCGSADVLEALGVSLEANPQKEIAQYGITFLFAYRYHPAMKEIAAVRKALGVRTVFNLIGPLLNPAEPEYMLLGVAHEDLLDLFAEVVQKLGMKRCILVHGNGMDELTPIGPCTLIEVTPTDKLRFRLDPEALGFKRCTSQDLQGGDKEINAQLLEKALGGEEGPIADTLILNAGVALYALGLMQTIEEGIFLSRARLKSGKALELLNKWRTSSESSR